MARVLDELLAPAGDGGAVGAETRERAAAAAAAITPAVAALELLADGALDVPWDGLVHRRCRIVPPAPGEGSGRSGREPVVQRLGSAERAGWWTARAEVEADGVLVVHELARRVTDESEAPSAPVPGAGTELSGAAAEARPADGRPAEGAAVLALRPGAGTSPGTCPGGQDPAGLRITPAAIASWAEATGDRNALHLRPGAARAAGLPAGPDEVVAHGLLLAALSLAVVPAGDGPVDLRLLAPCAVPAAGCAVDVDPVTGAVRAHGRTLLRRG